MSSKREKRLAFFFGKRFLVDEGCEGEKVGVLSESDCLGWHGNRRLILRCLFDISFGAVNKLKNQEDKISTEAVLGAPKKIKVFLRGLTDLLS